MSKKTEIKDVFETWIDYCFADNPLEKPIHLNDFLEKYVKENAGSLWASICVEDDHLVVEIKSGFHCIHIPIEAIKQALEHR